MTRFWVAMGVMVCMAASALPAAARKKPNPRALTLFKNAIRASNLQAKNGTPFRLQAEVHVFGTVGGQAGGMAIKFWAPDDMSRTETIMTGYNRVVVRNGKKSWTKASSEYAPFPVSATWWAMKFDDDLQSVLRGAVNPPSTKLTSRRQKEKRFDLGKPKRVEGTNVKCVQVKGALQLKSVYCFDSVNGLLTEIRGVNYGLRYEYGEYQRFGTKSFPRIIRVFYADGTQLLDIRIDEIDSLLKPGPKLFLPPPGSKMENAEAGCGKMVPTAEKVKSAKLFKMVQPVYPAKAKQLRISGRVEIYALIGKDGTTHALWVLESPAPMLTAAALDAVRQWRYSPTTLCGKKVPVGTVITVIFTLGQAP